MHKMILYSFIIKKKKQSEIEETVSSENHKAFDCHFYSTRESSSENQINGIAFFSEVSNCIMLLSFFVH